MVEQLRSSKEYVVDQEEAIQKITTIMRRFDKDPSQIILPPNVATDIARYSKDAANDMKVRLESYGGDNALDEKAMEPLAKRTRCDA